MMKIDEDLIFEQLEKVRNELVKYTIENLTREDLQTIIDIFPNPIGLIAEMQIEQMQREIDGDVKLMYDERISSPNF